MKTREERIIEVLPNMKQYYEMREKYPTSVFLFRCGDFYECYEEDASEVSRIVGITLSSQAITGSSERIKFAGFPHHALDVYLPKLVRAGKRIAIVDQLEAPKPQKKATIVDMMGATRHALTSDDLQDLYVKLENFIADCTTEEYLEYKPAFTQVKTFIHQQMLERR